MIRSSTLFVLLTLVISCKAVHEANGQPAVSSNSISSLQFLGEYDVPYNMSFKGTTIGGLSAIDYDTINKVYYLISDDRSDINPARFYTAKIFTGTGGIDSIQWVEVTSFTQQNGHTYPSTTQDPSHSPDPESIRYNPQTNQMVWSSEGERIVNAGKIVLENPAITLANKSGGYIDTFLLPGNMHMHSTEQGPRQNGVFEGLAFADNFTTLYANVEEPIYEDGSPAGTGDSTAIIRILKFDVATKKPVAQYAYKTEPVALAPIPAGAFKINGVSEILSVGKNQLLVIERSASSGNLGCVIRLFLADLTTATDVSAVSSLNKQTSVVPAAKKLLLNLNTLGKYIDNIEGVTFGPVLPNGHKTLVFVADNNFLFFQKSQVLLFEVIP